MKKLLDVGCGPGAIGNIRYYESVRKIYDIYGIDFLTKNITKIRKKFPLGKFSVADATSLPFSKAYFDAVIARHVLEHVEDSNAVVSEIKRVSKKGASLTIAVPDVRLERILSKTLPHYLEKGHHHQRIFNEESLKYLLKQNEFRILHYAKRKWLLAVSLIVLAMLSRITKSVKMEEQSGVFTIGKSYLEDRYMYTVSKKLYVLVDIYDRLFGFMNSLIPFEIEITAINI